MKVVRTFVAVLLAENLKRSISEVQERVKKLAPDVKWVAADLFHVTLKFLGNVREDELPRVYGAVEKAAGSVQPFDLSVGGLGAFPSPSRARVVWVAVEEGRDSLIELASRVEFELVRAGFAKEDKPFKAHITIGRVKADRSPAGLVAGIQEASVAELGRQRVTSVAVMQSDLHRDGPIYTPLNVFELG
jgi:2'-5' RNA ligase